MPTDTWKSFERTVAKYFNGTRVGGFGDNAVRQSCDVYTDALLIECKLRKELPTAKQIETWYNTVQERARKEFKQAILCVKVGGCHGFWIVQHWGAAICMVHSSWVKNDCKVTE